MTARRRKWLIAAALLLIAAAFAWWLTRKGLEMKVELRFVGYTNCPPVLDLGPQYGRNANGKTLFALVLATNSGAAEVLVNPWATARASLELPDFAIPYSTTEAAILKPGEAYMVALWPRDCTKPWFTEFGVQPHGDMERLFGSKRLHPQPEMNVKLGPITNLPPALPSLNGAGR